MILDDVKAHADSAQGMTEDEIWTHAWKHTQCPRTNAFSYDDLRPDPPDRVYHPCRCKLANRGHSLPRRRQAGADYRRSR